MEKFENSINHNEQPNENKNRLEKSSDDNQELSIQERIDKLEKERVMLIEWNRSDGHPDDYKRIQEVEAKINELVSKNYKESVEGIDIDLDSVDVNAARSKIALDQELYNLYRFSKRVVFSMTLDDGPVKRKDVIAEMLVALKNDDQEPRSIELLEKLKRILKESQK